jgi:glycosyltransferase involved in cell wall biosynthesis
MAYVPRICLNMIVKNETAIIRRFLTAVGPYIDEYCIVDTGSTDNTVEQIESCPIPGKVYHEPFQNFGYNRSHALEMATKHHASCEYLLLLDADMVFQSSLTGDQFRAQLKKDAYFIFQGTDAHYYKNVRMIRNPGFIQWPTPVRYWGVTHEYLQVPNEWSSELFDKKSVFILDVGDGGAKADKFQRDIRLLTQGLVENPNNDRYTFYLANSYRDAREYDKAIETFKKRIEIGGWIEEIWQSYYNIGKCYQYKGNMESAVYWWLGGYAAFPKRIENVYEVIKHYRQLPNQHRLAYMYFNEAYDVCSTHEPVDHLFLQKDVYDYKLWLELSIIGYYYNPRNYNLLNACLRVWNCPQTPDADRANVWSNYKFYAQAIHHDFPFPEVGQTISFLQTDEWVASTPSICAMPARPDGTKQWVVCRRFVNYRIVDGKYINQDKIKTVNVIAFVLFPVSKSRLAYTNDPILSQDPFVFREWILPYSIPDEGRYVGIEDVRLSWNSDTQRVQWTGVRGIQDKIVVAYGSFSDETDAVDFITRSSRPVEKNWIYVGGSNPTKIIYEWFPKQIGTLSETGEFIAEQTEDMPLCFKHARGSTPGVVGPNGETWFLVHFVSYESRRYYYHMWVVLDIELKLKQYSAPFTFTKSPVEYTLGFVYDVPADMIVIGYSVNDEKTCYTHIHASNVRPLLLDKCQLPRLK